MDYVSVNTNNPSAATFGFKVRLHYDENAAFLR